MPLSMILYGPLADKISIEILVIIAGIAMTIMGIAMLYDKKVKDYTVLDVNQDSTE